jgi:pimeloyl-ACP methyl ester carboxylesterase
MRTFTRAGLTFDVDDDGPRAGPAVVLLHGFPQDRSCWEGVRPPLVAAGYRVLAPDQRGYSPGARPQGRAAYRQRELAADVLALLDAAGVQQAHVVGHDWGGALAWALAASAPGRLLSTTSVSTPHPGAFTQASLASLASLGIRGGAQAQRSAYMALFQLPFLPERLLAGGVARRALVRSGLPEAHAERYLARLREPGAATGALAWYRAVPLGLRDADLVRPVRVPAMYVWSSGDVALSRAAAEGTASWVRGPYRFEVLEGVSHWVPEEAPEELARLLLDHLRSVPRPAATG